MPRLEDVIQLKEDEEVRAISRRHGLTIVPTLLLALLLIVTPFFFLFPLFSSGPPGVIAFIAVVIAGGVIAFRSFVMWDGDILIVTNQRIVDVDQQGVFARTVNEVSYENIQDFSWSKNTIIDQIFNIGHFKVRSASGSLTIEASFVPRPQELQNLVNDLRHEATTRRPAPLPQATQEDSPQRVALLKEVASKLEILDETELHKLARTLKKDDRDITIKRLFGTGEDAAAQGLKPLEDDVVDAGTDKAEEDEVEADAADEEADERI